MKMKLSNKYKTSEYIFLFSILVLALLLGTYFSFYAFLMRDIKSDIKGFSKDLHMNAMSYQEGMCNKKTEGMRQGPRQGTPLPMGPNPKIPGNIPA
jgi:regulatory protein YycI of two-component signal transduction system YycFG